MPDSSPVPTAPTDDPWPGCHGVRLRPPSAGHGYGVIRGFPFADAELVEGRAGPPGKRELWHLTGRVQLPAGPVAYDQRLTQHGDGSWTLHTQGGGLLVDPVAGRLTIEAETESLARQLVTTYGLPLLLSRHPTLVLHACAAVPPDGDRAVVVCAASGTGKSTLLVRLIEAGWQAVTEDVSIVDLREDNLVIWPGPPWVRREGNGPPRSRPRFTTADKTAWDIAPWQVDRAVGIARIVFMEPAGGSSIEWQVLDRPRAIADLARFSIWLGDPATRAAATFSPTVAIAGAVPAARLRLPVTAGWAEQAEAKLR